MGDGAGQQFELILSKINESARGHGGEWAGVHRDRCLLLLLTTAGHH